jgi:hypothetical protein
MLLLRLSTAEGIQLGFMSFYSINVLSKTHPILGGDTMGAFHILIHIHIHVHLHLQIHLIRQ